MAGSLRILRGKAGEEWSKVVLTVRIMQGTRSQRKGKGLDFELSIFIQNFVEYSLDVIEHFTSPTKKLPTPVRSSDVG